MAIFGVAMIAMICLFGADCVLTARDVFSRWATFSSRKRRMLLTQILGRALFVLGGLNFAVFWMMGVAIGGDALSGSVQNGHYYVATHGRFTEVSPALWNFSYYQALSLWVTSPGVMLTLLVDLYLGPIHLADDKGG
jgi:hypothetical protein